MAEAEAITLLLLPFACFVVLEPVEHIFPFYFAMLAKLCGDLLYLLCIWGAHSPSIEHL